MGFRIEWNMFSFFWKFIGIELIFLFKDIDYIN